MSATNATTYYELPVFIATDKPAWLTDWNGAMNAIDTAIKEALTAGENAQTTANTATTSIATINDSLTTINTSLSTLTSTVTGLVGSVNTINSLIGNGEPTTSDKTLIGAINEIYGMITGGGGGAEIQAQNVVYNNTASGLTADDVQSAIDEVNAKISTPEADDVTYDNTSSGLSATNVQDAIDELASGGAGGSTTYSTSEVDTGDKWTDNKPIYRKCYSADNVSVSSNTVIDATLTNAYVDMAVQIRCVSKDSDGEIFENFNTLSGSTSYSAYAKIDNTGLVLVAQNLTITKYNIIVEYTKPSA